MELRIVDHGQVIFQTHPIREPPHSAGRADEIPELPGVIQRSGIVVNMVMDVLAVCVGSNEKGILALRPAHRRFIANTVGIFWGNLSGLERLPDLIAEHIGSYLFPYVLMVLLIITGISTAKLFRKVRSC